MSTLTAFNGRLDDALLVVVDTGINGPQRLHVDVAPVWAQMLEDGMPSGCLTSGYRTLAEQAGEVTAMQHGQTPSALPPGQSWHGEGLAADIAEPARTWARARAATYGLRFPIANEPWHGELVNAHTHPTTTPTIPEDDMARLLKHPNGSIAIVGPGTAMTVLHSIPECDALRATGQATDPRIDLPNPQIWNLCKTVAQRAGTYKE